MGKPLQFEAMENAGEDVPDAQTDLAHSTMTRGVTSSSVRAIRRMLKRCVERLDRTLAEPEDDPRPCAPVHELLAEGPDGLNDLEEDEAFWRLEEEALWRLEEHARSWSARCRGGATRSAGR